MKRDLTENDVREDPEGAVLAIRRARREMEAAEQRVEQFELVFSAFDQLRRSTFAAPEYSPQWKARALTAEAALDAAGGEPVHVVEWEGLMDAERARQIVRGYDDEHDARQGVAHLLNWAIDYGRRGKPLAASTMTRCALRMMAKEYEGRPYSEAIDIEFGAWETDDIEERARDLLAVVAHRRMTESSERFGR